jgi:hypothetical protein
MTMTMARLVGLWARLALVLTCLMNPLGGRAAATETPEDLAEVATESWLKLVDDGKYGESWARSAKLFQGAVAKAEWEKMLSGTRVPLGKVVSRQVTSRRYAEHLPGAPDGKYVVIQLNTVFEHKAPAVETVTPMLDADGVWRVSGYYIR